MMKIKKKTVIIIAILAVILSGVAIFTFIIRTEPEKAILKIMADKVDLQVRNVRYTEVGDSGMKWEITADTARYQKKENLAFFEKVKIRLVMEDGRIFTMNGDRGRLNTQSRDVDVDGNVKVISENGDCFTTDRLSYLNAVKRIETNRPVLMENDNVRISGVGMVFPLEEKRITILGKVRAISGAVAGKKKENLSRSEKPPSAAPEGKGTIASEKKARLIEAGKKEQEQIAAPKMVQAVPVVKKKKKISPRKKTRRITAAQKSSKKRTIRKKTRKVSSVKKPSKKVKVPKKSRKTSAVKRKGK